MTLEQRAEALASKANECCYRSDGYENAMKATILEHLRAVVEACAEVADTPYSDAVEALGNDEPSTVGRKIARAIRREVGK